MIFSIFLLMDLDPQSFSTELFELVNPNDSLHYKTQKVQKGKKKNVLARTMADCQHMLSYAHQSKAFSTVVLASAILAILGVVLACFGNNVFLIIPLSIGLCSIPFILVRLYSYAYVKRLQTELETTLSIITTSYIRNNDIIAAVKENISYIKHPLQQVFIQFVTENEMINPNVRQSIDNLKERVDDDIFKEWCDGLKKCAKNSSLKYVLMPIVEKYAKLRKIMTITKPDLDGMKMTMITIIGIVYVNFPLLKFLSNDSNNWYDILVNTDPGKIVIAIIASITVFSVLRLIAIIKPLKYKV